MTHFLASDENQSDRDSEMDALLHAIQRDTAGQVQDYFSPQVAQTEKNAGGPTAPCREPAEQCEMDIHDCRYSEINR
ncbi:DUF2525 domain-containing protein [Pantoea sp. BS_4]|uniref:DUF2525 domain-containing protein n=1 Tax=Pantoea TaxID=53335 RepID=UPI0013904B47|nr:DUF2525 domain-containing protein [Pantoea stewartii]MBC0853056.1 DUF2525 domain-containing protein [Pantoea stewartii]MDF7785443.1 DUF2525 domain-containing protein [Pantoea stewartii]MEB6533680.1 YodD family protein [Pantoea stewartii]NRH23308.1 hypothetical protein [Pantoea stewartii]UYK98184.1 YodD family protein [Pantoea stewartii]